MIFFPIFMRRSKPVTHEKPLDIQITDAQIEMNNMQIEQNNIFRRRIEALEKNVELLILQSKIQDEINRRGYEEGGEI